MSNNYNYIDNNEGVFGSSMNSFNNNQYWLIKQLIWHIYIEETIKCLPNHILNDGRHITQQYSFYLWPENVYKKHSAFNKWICWKCFLFPYIYIYIYIHGKKCWTFFYYYVNDPINKKMRVIFVKECDIANKNYHHNNDAVYDVNIFFLFF